MSAPDEEVPAGRHSGETGPEGAVGTDGLWRFSYGPHGTRITAMERGDRPGRIRVSWTVRGTDARTRQQRRTLNVSVRGAEPPGVSQPRQTERGIDRAAARRVAALVTAAWSVLEAGGDPDFGRAAASRPARRGAASVHSVSTTRGAPGLPGAAASVPLTLREGFAWFERHRAARGGGLTRHDRYVLRRIPELLAEVIPLGLPWVALTGTRLTTLVEDLTVAAPRLGIGYRTAKLALMTLFRVARHLTARGGIPRMAEAWPGWTTDLRQMWLEHHGAIVIRRPRFTAAELQRFYASLEYADPRFALLATIGGARRLGQIRNARRRLLELERTAELPHGVLRFSDPTPDAEVITRNRKSTLAIALLPGEAEQFQHLLDTLLREYEAAYRAGVIDDYPLFPGDAASDGVLPFRSDARPITRKLLLAWFHAHAARAGVPHVPGRGWYGARRKLLDRADVSRSDDPLLARQLSDHSAVTRDRVYRDPGAAELLRKGSAARRELLAAAGVSVPGQAAVTVPVQMWAPPVVPRVAGPPTAPIAPVREEAVNQPEVAAGLIEQLPPRYETIRLAACGRHDVVHRQTPRPWPSRTDPALLLTARALRRDAGLGLAAIARRTTLSKSALSIILEDLPLTAGEIRRRKQASGYRSLGLDPAGARAIHHDGDDVLNA